MLIIYIGTGTRVHYIRYLNKVPPPIPIGVRIIYCNFTVEIGEEIFMVKGIFKTLITTSGRVYLVNLNNYERESRVPSNAPRG